MAHLTEIDVHEAALALIRDGRSPGIEAVAASLGRGSRTTVHKYLQSFWLTLDDRLRLANTAPPMPGAVADLADTLWFRASELAQAAADERVASREACAQAKELQACEALGKAAEVSEAASVEIARAHEGRSVAEQRAETAASSVRDKSAALARAVALAEEHAVDRAHLQERGEQLERHLATLETTHAGATGDLKAAHADDIQRAVTTHEREMDRFRVELDRERQRSSAQAAEAAQREVNQQKEMAAARQAQLAAATAEARSRSETERVTLECVWVRKALEERDAALKASETDRDALRANERKLATALMERESWFSPAQLEVALIHELKLDRGTAGVKRDARAVAAGVIASAKGGHHVGDG